MVPKVFRKEIFQVYNILGVTWSVSRIRFSKSQKLRDMELQQATRTTKLAGKLSPVKIRN